MKYLLIVSLAFLSHFSQAQPNGYEIKVKVTPLKNEYVFLGHYSGNQYPLDDSALLNNEGEAIFKGDKKLGGGIYIIVMPKKNRFVEILVDENEQHFAVQMDTTNLTKVNFSNTALNSKFLNYQKEIVKQGEAMEKNRTLLNESKNHTDSIKYAGEINAAFAKMKEIRKKVLAENPDNLLGLLMRLMSEPMPSQADSLAADKNDSLFAYRYVKNHFWDDIYFYDERLSRLAAPLFDEKMDNYFKNFVYPSADSVIKELDYILSYASANKEMTRYLLVKFINRYFAMKYMWEDAVFVHLFQKYFDKKEYPWLAEKDQKTITNKAYNLMANIMGNKAENIVLEDDAGKEQSLYQVQAPLTIVVFYDPTCGHCKETLPKLDSLHQNNWLKNGIKVFAVAKEDNDKKEVWHDFIKKYSIENFINVYCSKAIEEKRVSSNIPSYLQLYGVDTFPTIFLLDANKKIVAKKLSWQQADDIISLKLKDKL